MTIIRIVDSNIDKDGNLIFSDPQPAESSPNKKLLTYSSWQSATSIHCNASKIKVLRQEIPESVKLLSFAGCTNLEIVAHNIPENIETLDFAGCITLKKLPDLSNLKNLKFLNLTGCDSLDIQQISSLLKELESRECEIIYPEDKRTIKDVKNAVENIDEKALPLTSKLLNRYLTEKSEQRDKGITLAKNVKQFLELLKPESYQISEKLSGIFAVDGCTNRPVAGFFEIISWLKIANQTNDSDRFRALDPLVANQTIMDFVRSDDFKTNYGGCGEEAEAELVNTLLSIVNKMVNPENSLWSGVPNKIVNSGLIDHLISNKDMIVACQSLVEKSLTQSPDEKFEYLMNRVEGFAEMWGSIVFPKEIKEIKEKYETQRSQIDISLADKLESSELKAIDDIESKERIEIADFVMLSTKKMAENLTPNNETMPKSVDLLQSTNKLSTNIVGI